MIAKKIIEMDSDNRCFHEFSYYGHSEPIMAASHLDVTARSDGPFLGQIYNRELDSFSYPPPPPEETQDGEEEGRGE